jgi:hypothetical protein
MRQTSNRVAADILRDAGSIQGYPPALGVRSNPTLGLADRSHLLRYSSFSEESALPIWACRFETADASNS